MKAMIISLMFLSGLYSVSAFGFLDSQDIPRLDSILPANFQSIPTGGNITGGGSTGELCAFSSANSIKGSGISVLLPGLAGTTGNGLGFFTINTGNTLQSYLSGGKINLISGSAQVDLYTDANSSLITTKSIKNLNASVWEGYALCYTQGGMQGHCMSSVDAAGKCTCVLN